MNQSYEFELYRKGPDGASNTRYFMFDREFLIGKPSDVEYVDTFRVPAEEEGKIVNLVVRYRGAQKGLVHRIKEKLGAEN